MTGKSELLNDENTGIILVDVQDKLFPYIHNKFKILDNIQKIIKFAKITEIPIILTEQNPNGLGRTIKEICKGKCKEFEISSEHKADLNHKIVGAASILAKVTRDKEIDKIKAKTKIEVGSGYPSDEVTQKALTENLEELEPYLRKCWSTYKRIKGEKFQASLGEF